jgi:hypothetical protein
MPYCTLGIVGLWADVQLAASSHTILIIFFINCLWSCGRITKCDINKLSIKSRCGTVLDIVGLWADAQLTACIQSILNMSSIACGLLGGSQSVI